MRFIISAYLSPCHRFWSRLFDTPPSPPSPHTHKQFPPLFPPPPNDDRTNAHRRTNGIIIKRLIFLCRSIHNHTAIFKLHAYTPYFPTITQQRCNKLWCYQRRLLIPYCVEMNNNATCQCAFDERKGDTETRMGNGYLLPDYCDLPEKQAGVYLPPTAHLILLQRFLAGEGEWSV